MSRSNSLQLIPLQMIIRGSCRITSGEGEIHGKLDDSRRPGQVVAFSRSICEWSRMTPKRRFGWLISVLNALCVVCLLSFVLYQAITVSALACDYQPLPAGISSWERQLGWLSFLSHAYS